MKRVLFFLLLFVLLVSQLHAAVEIVSQDGSGEVVFSPSAVVQPVLSAVATATGLVCALILVWILTRWLFDWMHSSVGSAGSSSNPWILPEGGVVMPAEYGAVAYGATDQEGGTVTVFTDSGDVVMSRADYDRWQSMVQSGGEQGAETF